MKTKKPDLRKIFTSPSSTNRNGMFAFTQQPSENQFPVFDKPTGKPDEPTELFGRFTADIIKKDVVFTR